MGRVLSIDYGLKRCGIAVSDPLKISINPLKVIPPEDLLAFLKSYISNENVEILVIGWPLHKDGKETYLTGPIHTFLTNFAKLFPEISIEKVDESFSSFEAKSLILQLGFGKSKRRSKELIDQSSAIILLKRYLDSL